MTLIAKSNPLRTLEELAERGAQPVGRAVWLGLGYRPPKQCSISISPNNLPSDDECCAVAGLDIFVCFHGYATRYGVLHSLCGALYQARPRRLLIIDLDYKRTAFLKLGAK
ncbi:MAG: hypothetical protein V4447_07050 [Pseudomonadota bacterium]